jgi:F0F1-type ATP synthase delta subunit
MANKDKVIIKKIPLDELLETLEDLYVKGVDFIDLVAGENDNKISLIFTEEYMSEEAREYYEDNENEDDVEIYIESKLSDEDLNQLL